MFTITSLYKVTVRNTGHDICANMYWEEGDEWNEESWDRTFSWYGYAIFPSVFHCEEGGSFSRKDSDITEILSIEKVDSLPEGEEVHPYYQNTFKDIHRGILRRYHWTRFFISPRYYSLGKYSSLKYDLKRLWRHLMSPFRTAYYRIKYDW